MEVGERTSIEQQLVQFIQSELSTDITNVSVDTDDLLESGVLDSAGIAQLIGFIEHTYAVSIDDVDLIAENFDSVAQVTSMIAAKLADSARDVD